MSLRRSPSPNTWLTRLSPSKRLAYPLPDFFQLSPHKLNAWLIPGCPPADALAYLGVPRRTPGLPPCPPADAWLVSLRQGTNTRVSQASRGRPGGHRVGVRRGSQASAGGHGVSQASAGGHRGKPGVPWGDTRVSGQARHPTNVLTNAK